jgi:FKBP-type peptidyl-prolyl cis-trans isomerase FkpA
MKSILVKHIIFLLIVFFLSCPTACKSKSEEKETSVNNNSDNNTNNNNTSLPIEYDSADYNAAVVIGEDGKIEYIDKKASGNFLKTSSGLEYKFIERSGSKINPKIGDIIVVSLKYTYGNDSLIFDSDNIDANFRMRVKPPSHSGGSIEEAYMMMQKGDSAAFKIDAKNFYQQTQGLINIPRYFKDGDKLTFYIRLKEVLTSAEFARNNEDIYNHQIKLEESLINRFLMDINLEHKRYESGLVQVTIEEGSGPAIKKGDIVKIDYIASFIDGAPFDSSLDHNEAFEFTAGNNEVIAGLDEGILKMKKGEIALLIIPFRLAYGDEKTGIIPPFSTLVFELEVIDAK